MSDKHSTGNGQYQIDTSISITTRSEEIITNPYDSFAKAYVDTSTLKGKRKWIMNQFLSNERPSIPDYDTLFDLNYDGFKDYVIGYYGQSGTGIKNRINVYFYNPKANSYTLPESETR